MTQTRAIEEGLPLVRVANTGVSAVIDPMGRIVKKLDLGQEGVVDSDLPSALSPTIYARFGVKVPLILAGLFLLFAFKKKK
jgi:apolipoprotein N-acyltransferase